MEMKAVKMAVKTASGSSTGEEILDRSIPRNEDRDGGGGVFCESSPPPLGQVFFLIYEGIRRRPEARRCLRPNLGGPTRPGTVAAWDHPFWPSGTPSCPSFVQ